MTGGAGVSENRVDPPRRPTNWGDAVQGVTPAEQCQGAGPRLEGAHGLAGAVEYCLHCREILRIGGPDPGNVLELAAFEALLQHQRDGKLAVVEVPAELVTLVVEHDRARAHGVGVAVKVRQVQRVFEEGYEAI